MQTNVSLLAVLALCGAAAAQSLPDTGEVALKAKIQRRQKLLLPGESPTAVGTGFHFEDGIGADFRVDVDGEALLIDADGDGSLETRVEGDSGFVVLANGERRYGAALAKGAQWSFTAGSVATGKLGATKVRIIDQNHNGRFDDVGEDAMVIGNGRAACFLSEVVEIEGALRRVTVAADGSKLSWAPFEGESATLSLHAVTEGKVMAAVINSTDGRYSLHLSKHDTAVRVPAGSYLMHSGQLAMAGSRVSMVRGRSKPFALAAGRDEKLDWGGPVKAEFAYASQGGQLKFSPKQIWFYGARNEEYRNWNPVGQSPLIRVTNKATGHVIAETRFPGSC